MIRDKYARKYYEKITSDPVLKAKKDATRKVWYEKNKKDVLEKQKTKKRLRKLQAIEHLGGKCKVCKQVHHPAVYEFHHRNPEEKDRDPSKMLQLSWSRVVTELDKCDLLCANCHRMVHHNWESE